ncbi:MAG: rRNA pseudouridine synthase [Holosporaceae bacterium]|jgi:23S rRNA pseudouridine2605 synthase|nr:rRNA pseudouridine synthase [Holosporaceae bacterium]
MRRDIPTTPCPNEGIRLAKRIAEGGAASRRGAESLIEEGRVSVNGTIVTTPVFFVTPEDVVCIDGKKLFDRAGEIILWKFHKPRSVITSRRDPQGRATVFDLFEPSGPSGPSGPNVGRVLAIGRLDYNSEGLLLFTNSGLVARKIELPSSGLTRVYRTRIFGKLGPDAIQALKRGVVIDSIAYGPIDVLGEYGSSRSSNGWITVSLAEGKNREVRKVMAHFGCQVNRLIRTSYGPFQLESLAPGQWGKAKASEIRALKQLIPSISASN